MQIAWMGKLACLQREEIVIDEIMAKETEDKRSLKEQEMSSISYWLSAPVVAQASVETNERIDSCTAEHDLVIDEGSGIDDCWSSDDGLA